MAVPTMCRRCLERHKRILHAPPKIGKGATLAALVLLLVAACGTVTTSELRTDAGDGQAGGTGGASSAGGRGGSDVAGGRGGTSSGGTAGTTAGGAGGGYPPCGSNRFGVSGLRAQACSATGCAACNWNDFSSPAPQNCTTADGGLVCAPAQDNLTAAGDCNLCP